METGSFNKIIQKYENPPQSKWCARAYVIPVIEKGENQFLFPGCNNVSRKGEAIGLNSVISAVAIFLAGLISSVALLFWELCIKVRTTYSTCTLLLHYVSL